MEEDMDEANGRIEEMDLDVQSLLKVEHTAALDNDRLNSQLWNHQEILEDQVSIKAFYRAIMSNRHLFKDKVIMDLACGTGILSLFAAKAGARRVIGIESTKIADYAIQIMIDNEMDHIITIIKSKVTDIKRLPDGIDKVDLIISKFMGLCLFWEGKTEAVLYARDTWLIPNGIIFPDKAELYIMGFSNPLEKSRMIDIYKKFVIKATPTCEAWKNLMPEIGSDVDTSDIEYDLTEFRKLALQSPTTDVITPSQFATLPSLLKAIDLYTLTIEELKDFTMNIKLRTCYTGTMHGVATYFIAYFTKCFKMEAFTTAPGCPTTYWRQVTFYFDNEIKIKKNENMTGSMRMRKNPSFKDHYVMTLKLKYPSGWGPQKSWSEENTYYSIEI